MVFARPGVIEPAPLQDQQRKRYPQYTESRILLNSKCQIRVSKLLPSKKQNIHPRACRNRMDESDEYLKDGHQISKGWKHGNSLGITNAYIKIDNDNYHTNELESVVAKNTSKESQSQIPQPRPSIPNRITNLLSAPEISNMTKKDKFRTSWRESSPGYSETASDSEGDSPFGRRIGSPSPALRIKPKTHKENIPPNVTYSKRKNPACVAQNSVSKHQRDEIKLKKFSAHSNPFPMKRRDLNLFKKANENSGQYEPHLEGLENLVEKQEPQNKISNNQESKPESHSELPPHNPDDFQKITTEVAEIEAEYRNSCADTHTSSIPPLADSKLNSSVNSEKGKEAKYHDASSVHEKNSGLPICIKSLKDHTINTRQLSPRSSRSSLSTPEKQVHISGTHCYLDGDLNISEELKVRRDFCNGDLNGMRGRWVSQRSVNLEPVKSPPEDLDISAQNPKIKRREGSPSLKKVESMSLKLQAERFKQSFLPRRTFPSEIMEENNIMEKKSTNSDAFEIHEAYSEPELNYQTSSSSDRLKKNIESKTSDRPISQPKLNLDPIEFNTSVAKLYELQSADNTSDYRSIRSVSPVQSLHINQERSSNKPIPEVEPLPIRTPKITGAFIETPVFSRKFEKKIQINDHQRAVSLEDPASKQEGLSDSRISKLPTLSTSKKSYQQGNILESTRSALVNTHQRTTVSEDIKLIKSEENIEDSEIDFLEEFAMERSGSAEKMSTDKLIDLDYVETESLMDIEGKRERPDQMIIESMNRKLMNASHSIHDAQQGIERLEKQVSLSSSRQGVEVNHNDKENPFRMPRLYISTPTSRSDKPTGIFYNRNWQLTWLGFIFLFVLLWFIAELTFCEVYCHPKYSSENKWHPTDPFFPYAIPTKIDQWSGRIFSGNIKRILDWWNPARYTQQRPKQPYSGYDWWVGESGPAPIFVPEPFYDMTDRIDDDEIWE